MKKIALVVLCMMLSGCWEIGTGEKIGTVVRLNKQGFFCKTWEGQMVRGGFTDGSGVAGTLPFEFTIEDDKLAEKVKEAMEAQKMIRVKYKMEFNSFCRSDSMSTFLTELEYVK